jgi:two-component system, cell cycle sensor histidine kinase and response regulator CckA
MNNSYKKNSAGSDPVNEEGPETYRNLFATMTQGVVYYSADGQILSANPAAERILGLPFARMQGRKAMDPDWRTVGEDGADLPGTEHPVLLALASGRPVLGTVIGVLQPEQGRHCWLLVDAMPEFRGGQDRPWRVFTVFTDITERLLAEAALRQSEERFRLTFQASPDSVNINRLDDGMYVDVNEGFTRLTGYRAGEVLGRTSADINIWHDLSDRQKLVQEILAKGYCNDLEARFRRKDGSVGHGRMSARVITLKNVPHIISVTRDVTEQTEALQALRTNKNLLDSILRTAPTAIGVVSNRVFLVVNERMCLMTGYAQDELVGKNARMLYPDDREYEYVGMEKYRQISLDKTGSVETRWRRKDGEIVEILLCSSPINPNDLVSGVTFTALDISEGKQAEAEREKLQAQLLQAQKIESIGRLAGGVAHDFNNMLTVILGHAEMAIKNFEQSDPVHANLEIIIEAAYRSADLVRQLLAFARKQTVEPKILELSDYIAGMLPMLMSLINEDIDLVWKPGAESWLIRIDPSQVDQLVANLCVNARDAIDGVGKITIETENVTFDAAYCAVHTGFMPGEYVQLCVSDNGAGMDKEVIEHIFEPFFTTKERGRGTGLGLAGVYGIVRQNNGFVNVYSEPDKGSSFKIYLPRFSGGHMEELFGKTSSVPRGSGELVLLVEDEAAILNVGKEMLERLGFRVLTAASPSEALRQAHAHMDEIRLLITDVIMPEMNGRDLARVLVGMKADLPCLFTSGYTANVIAHHGVLDNGIHFIQKPFSSKDLALAVWRILTQEK